MCEGRVLYHAHVAKTAEEAAALQASHEQRAQLKESRRRQQVRAGVLAIAAAAMEGGCMWAARGLQPPWTWAHELTTRVRLQEENVKRKQALKKAKVRAAWPCCWSVATSPEACQQCLSSAGCPDGLPRCLTHALCLLRRRRRRRPRRPVARRVWGRSAAARRTPTGTGRRTTTSSTLREWLGSVGGRTRQCGLQVVDVWRSLVHSCALAGKRWGTPPRRRTW